MLQRLGQVECGTSARLRWLRGLDHRLIDLVELSILIHPQVGMWLSLVERSFRVGEVGSSNLPIPTNTLPQFKSPGRGTESIL